MTSSMSEISEHAPLSGGTSSRSVDRGGALPAARAGASYGRALVSSPYPRVVGRAARHFARAQIALWDHALRHVRRVQEKTLLSLLDHAKETEFGRAHGFARITSYDDYVQRVAVGDYDAFSPYIERMRAGERNVLVPEFVQCTLGNSLRLAPPRAASKFLPITDRQIRWQQRAGADARCSCALPALVSGDDDLLTRLHARPRLPRRRPCAPRGPSSSRRTRR